jgi:hypothetical protein
MKDASDYQQLKGVTVTRNPLGLILCDVGDEEQSTGVYGLLDAMKNIDGLLTRTRICVRNVEASSILAWNARRNNGILRF